MAKDDILYNMRRFKKPLDDLSEFVINQPITIHGPNTFRRNTIGCAISETADNLSAANTRMDLRSMVLETWKIGREVIEWEAEELDNESSTDAGSEVTLDEMAFHE